jgi:multidrug resistance efflux pump
VSGGVLDQLAVAVGDRVAASAELGLVRPRTDSPVEVLTAPRAGTVLSVPASVGDTLAPGAVVVIVADVSKLQVETTDLDEFLVARIQPGQRVQLSIPALDNRALRGLVRTVAPRPETSSSAAGTTSDSYPVVVDITDAIPPRLAGGHGRAAGVRRALGAVVFFRRSGRGRTGAT